MAEQPRKRRPRRFNEPYQERTNAINLTVYDMYGNVVTDDVAHRVLNAVTDATADYRGLAISWTRL